MKASKNALGFAVAHGFVVYLLYILVAFITLITMRGLTWLDLMIVFSLPVYPIVSALFCKYYGKRITGKPMWFSYWVCLLLYLPSYWLEFMYLPIELNSKGQILESGYIIQLYIGLYFAAPFSILSFISAIISLKTQNETTR